jgi:hypothetical protein
MKDILKQNNTLNKPLDVARLEFLNWVNSNIFGKERSRLDAYFYNLVYRGGLNFHAEADLIKNVSSSDINLAFAPSNSTTNLLFSHELLQAGQYSMLKSFIELKLGTVVNSFTVANVGNPVTAQTITLGTLSNGAYYVVFFPVNKACKFEITVADIINNTAIGVAGGLAAGLHGVLFKTTNTTPVITLTAALGVGLTAGAAQTNIKLYPVSEWVLNELKIISCSEVE